MKSSIWYEKYKPNYVKDLCLPAELKNKLQDYVNRGDIPSLGLFSSEPGTGKSATSHAIIKELGCEAIWINASLESGIDTLRGRIRQFASSSSFDDNLKVVVMDECLEENEEVRIGTVNDWVPKKLNELTKGVIYPCVSFNMETGEYENDTCEIISDKEDDIYEVTLEDGRTVKVTSNHPFIVLENGKYIEKSIDDGLSSEDYIVNLA